MQTYYLLLLVYWHVRRGFIFENRKVQNFILHIYSSVSFGNSAGEYWRGFFFSWKYFVGYQIFVLSSGWLFGLLRGKNKNLKNRDRYWRSEMYMTWNVRANLMRGKLISWITTNLLNHPKWARWNRFTQTLDCLKFTQLSRIQLSFISIATKIDQLQGRHLKIPGPLMNNIFKNLLTRKS